MMSKRFGRNQKRNLTQQLAVQQADAERFKMAYQMSDGLQAHTSRELAKANDQLRVIYHEIGKNLNPYHPLLPSELRRELAVTAADMGSVRISTDRMTFKVVDVLRKRLITDEFMNQVAIRVSHGSKVLGYAIDIKSLLVESFRKEYINELSRDIARQLVDGLCKQGGAV